MAQFVLVPGSWLGAWAWDEVAESLRRAGHEVEAVTLPGLESVRASRASIRLADHVAAVTRLIVERDMHDVILVGHSAGGTVIYGVTDAVPDRIARAVYVDSGPLAEGVAMQPDLPADVTEMPLPTWAAFEANGTSLAGLSDAQRDLFRRRAVPHPAGPARDPARLHDERRLAVPVSVIASSFPVDQVQALIAADHPWFAELGRLDVTYAALPTGHWPMFSRPADLAALLAEAAAPSEVVAH